MGNLPFQRSAIGAASIEDKMAVAIHAKGLTKSFGGASAVNGLDLDVRPGELVALLGPSGSGKTTLLRMVAGLELPEAGRIAFDQEDATHLSMQDRRVGFVFQHYALFRHMTVASNIAYGLRVRPRQARPGKDEIRRRVDELLELVQLSGLGGRYPTQLSGGQRQRVALARALAVEPKVLLLDEPFGALDAQVRRDLRRWLREIHDRTGHTTLFVTHDQEEALELADRVAIVNRGRIEQIGAPDEILDCPATAFVAGFVGEAVRLPVRISQGRLFVGSQAMPIQDAVADGPAELFVRPDDITLMSGGNGGLRTCVRAIRRTGGARRAELSIEDGLPSVEIELSLDHAVAKGDKLNIALSTKRLFGAIQG